MRARGQMRTRKPRYRAFDNCRSVNRPGLSLRILRVSGPGPHRPESRRQGWLTNKLVRLAPRDIRSCCKRSLNRVGRSKNVMSPRLHAFPTLDLGKSARSWRWEECRAQRFPRRPVEELPMDRSRRKRLYLHQAVQLPGRFTIGDAALVNAGDGVP